MISQRLQAVEQEEFQGPIYGLAVAGGGGAGISQRRHARAKLSNESSVIMAELFEGRSRTSELMFSRPSLPQRDHTVVAGSNLSTLW